MVLGAGRSFELEPDDLEELGLEDLLLSVVVVVVVVTLLVFVVVEYVSVTVVVVVTVFLGLLLVPEEPAIAFEDAFVLVSAVEPEGLRSEVGKSEVLGI